MKKIMFIILISSQAFASLNSQVQKYDNRYNLQSKNQKLVDNTGEGFEELYGVRNFRTVLKGIMYRGGANNYYNKYQKRDNQNPLPTMGLQNLCKEGFGTAVYLYETNFSKAVKSASCENFEREKNQINYRQLNGVDEKNENVFLEMIYKAIKGQVAAPLYFHCWNGWHASGYVSTLALRQFCGLNAEQAVSYWEQNTDGHFEGFTKLKTRIRNFKFRPEFKITAEEQKQICL